MVCGKETILLPKIAFFWQLLPLVPESFFSEMFCDSCAQSHPSYSYLPPHKTHKHRQTCCVCIPAVHENTGRGNRNSCRLWAKRWQPLLLCGCDTAQLHRSNSLRQFGKDGAERETSTKCRNQWMSYCLSPDLCVSSDITYTELWADARLPHSYGRKSLKNCQCQH